MKKKLSYFQISLHLWRLGHGGSKRSYSPQDAASAETERANGNFIYSLSAREASLKSAVLTGGVFFFPEAPSNMGFVLHKSFTSLPFGLATCEGLWLAASGTTGMQME